nr:MAG TPA: hypothetical protein [Caudoviricetes sp.]
MPYTYPAVYGINFNYNKNRKGKVLKIDHLSFPSFLNEIYFMRINPYTHFRV